MANQAWRGWWRIGGLTAPPGAPVSCVARTPDLLDIFVAADDGKTYSAAWDPDQANGQWRGRWNILTGAITPGGAIAAVSEPAASWTSSWSAWTTPSTPPHGTPIRPTANGEAGGASGDRPQGRRHGRAVRGCRWYRLGRCSASVRGVGR